MKIINIVGARPNFMKIAPIMRAMKPYRQIEPVLVHTGQHYDNNMSDTFFKDLDIPEPDIYLGVGSETHAVQTARIMERFEKVLLKEKPDLVLVVGDVNSTLACSLVASKFRIKIAHVEAGLRSFDRSMPEEINRMVTDSLSDYLFITCEDARNNLLREGIDPKKIYFTGNVMIDTLFHAMGKLKKKNGSNSGYAVVTLHRPCNVDNKNTFKEISTALNRISKYIPIYFPVHPRTRKQIKTFGLERYYDGSIALMDPLGYRDFLKLYSNSTFVLTDSGGIQEETSVLDIPCITLRKNTERPVTITRGTNVLVGSSGRKIVQESLSILNGRRKRKKTIKYWDGKAAERIVKILIKRINVI